ncbi:hypothetical protein HY642_06680 [Candidatus Woesearchaeota archaeon]|nr:hypothetical protein [Candidatus Woesearchaeota archaeon]
MTHIAGISFETNKFEVLTLDDRIQVVDRKQHHIKGLAYHKEIVLSNMPEEPFLTLGQDNWKRWHLIVHCLKGATREFKVPDKAVLTGLYSDAAAKQVYAWDWNTRQLLSWNYEGEIVNRAPLSQTPSAYAKLGSSLLIGTLEGVVLKDFAPVADVRARVQRLVPTPHGVHVICTDKHKGHSPFPSELLHVPDYNATQGREFEDMAEHNGILYAACMNELYQFSGMTPVGKFINGAAGYIKQIMPANIGRNEALLFRTGLDGLGWASCDFHMGEESFRQFVDTQYSACVVV